MTTLKLKDIDPEFNEIDEGLSKLNGRIQDDELASYVRNDEIQVGDMFNRRHKEIIIRNRKRKFFTVATLVVIAAYLIYAVYINFILR